MYVILIIRVKKMSALISIFIFNILFSNVLIFVNKLTNYLYKKYNRVKQ